jgi:hypothetical protein
MPVARIKHNTVDRGGGIPEPRAANGPAALHGRLDSADNGAGKINRNTAMAKLSTIADKYSAAEGSAVEVPARAWLKQHFVI